MRPAILLLVLLVPTLALAQTGLGLDLGASGAYVGKTMGLARSFWVLMFIVALLVEAFRSAPGEARDFGGAIFRAVLVVILLFPLPGGKSAYGYIFGSLYRTSGTLAAAVAPTDVWERYTAAQTKWMDQIEKDAAANAAKGGVLDRAAGILKTDLGIRTGIIFDSVIAVGVLFAQASQWVLVTLAKAVAAVLFILGPLALVFAIPRGSGSAGRWLRTYISVLTWPVLSALLLEIGIGIGATGMVGRTPAFASAATALLMALMAAGVPAIASALVGGSMNAVGGGLAGARMATGLAQALAKGVGAAATGPARLARAGAAGAGASGATAPPSSESFHAAASAGPRKAGGVRERGMGRLSASLLTKPAADPAGASGVRGTGNGTSVSQLAHEASGPCGSTSGWSTQPPSRHVS